MVFLKKKFKNQKKCFEIILKYTFHKIFIKISQKLRPADGRTHARTGTGTESYHLLYDSTTTNTSPNTSGLTLGRRDFNFRTTGFALATPGLRPGQVQEEKDLGIVVDGRLQCRKHCRKLYPLSIH